MTASIEVEHAPAVQYLLRLADTCLILGQRLAEWCGHAPVLEEDIALANIGARPDRPGARAAHARRPARAARAYDEDQLAFLRDERDYLQRDPRRAAARRLRLHRAAQRDDGHLASADVGAAARVERRRAGRHRRQGGEGSALPPAARRRLGGAAGRRHRRIGAPHARRARRAVALHAPSCSTPTRSMPRPRPTAWARAGTRCASRGWPRCGACSTRPSSRCRPTRRSAAPASAACTASTWATSWPRCSTCSARIPGARGDAVSTAMRATAQSSDARLGACCDGVLDPEVPALSVRDLGIVRDVIDARRRPRGRADAHLLRLPGHRGDRAQRARGARRRRPRPRARDLAPRAGVDHRLDQRRRQAQAARVRHRAAERHAGRSRRSADPHRAARQAIECPRCGSTNTERLSAFGSTACKALYRCMACREPFEHFKPI